MPPVPETLATVETTPLSAPMVSVPGYTPDLQVVLSWLETTVFPHPTSRLSYATIPVGIAIGFAGAYSGYTLGSGFGGTVARWTSASNIGTSIAQIYFGTVSYTPVAILISMPTQQLLQQYAKQWQGDARLPTLDDRPNLRAFATFFTQFVSLFAGTPFFNLVYEQLADYAVLNYLLPSCALISSYCAIISPSNALKDNLLDRFEIMTPAVNAARTTLCTQIDSAIHGIKLMSNAEIQALYAELRNTNNPAFTRLQKLLDRQVTVAATNDTATTHYYHRTLIRDLLGYGIGGASAYVFYNLAVQTANSMVANAGFGAFVGVIGCGVNAIFTAKWGQARAETLYTPGAGYANLQPSLRGVGLQILAISGSAPGTYVAITTATGVFGWLGGLATFIGGGLAKYPGFDYLVNTLVDFYEEARYADTADVQRKHCLKMLGAIRQQIRHLHPTQLLALSKTFPVKPATSSALASIRVETPGSDNDKKSVSRVVIHQSLFSPANATTNDGATPPVRALRL